MTNPADALRTQLIRNIDAVPRTRFERAPLYDSMCASLSDGTVAQKLGVVVDVLPPGARSCPYHFHHAQEEMFIVLEGSGTLRVAGEMLAIVAGDVMTIPAGPAYPHHIINTSSAPLKYLSISTQERPEVCEYPDSGKVAAFNHGPLSIHRRADSLDYWDGEA
jgi:uncharacterized cupin superfamily protein